MKVVGTVVSIAIPLDDELVFVVVVSVVDSDVDVVAAVVVSSPSPSSVGLVVVCGA